MLRAPRWASSRSVSCVRRGQPAAFHTPRRSLQIEITKLYRLAEFHEDLKKLYSRAGVEGRPTTFLFSDTQVKDETFLEDINNILSSGEVPNLFLKDEKARERGWGVGGIITVGRGGLITLSHLPSSSAPHIRPRCSTK
jgi:hypothetical protein